MSRCVSVERQWICQWSIRQTATLYGITDLIEIGVLTKKDKDTTFQFWYLGGSIETPTPFGREKFTIKSRGGGLSFEGLQPPPPPFPFPFQE